MNEYILYLIISGIFKLFIIFPSHCQAEDLCHQIFDHISDYLLRLNS